MKRFVVRNALIACAVAATLSQPALAELRTFTIETTTVSPTATATGSVTFDDAVCINPGGNQSGAPAGCVVALSVTISGAAAGNGTFTEVDFSGPGYYFSPTVALNWDAELIAQGVSDFNVFFNAPGPSGFMPFAFSANGGEQFTIVSLTPGEVVAPEFPFASASQQCADAVGKAGAKYFAARHKSLHACRSAFMKGVALFADKAKTVAVTLPADCAGEYKAAAQIEKAAAKLRASVAKKCTDAVLETLFACGTTVEALADATGTNGCLVDAIETSVDDQLDAEFGF